MREMGLRNNIRPRLITMLRNGFVLISVEINFRVFARKNLPRATNFSGCHTAEIYSRIKVVADIFFASRNAVRIIVEHNGRFSHDKPCAEYSLTKNCNSHCSS